MAISDEQRKRARAISQHGGPNVVGAFLRAATEPEELHEFAQHWNFDYGAATLLRVLEHPACDLATALMAFWRGGPNLYLPFKDDGVEGMRDEDDSYGYLKAVHARLLRRRDWRHGLAYDPTDDWGHNDLTQNYGGRRESHGLPEWFYRPAPQREV
jgi:Domain of unknown function (DUF4274)